MNIYNKILLSTCICAVSLTALYYGTLAAIPHFVDLNKYKDNIFSAVEKETGYKISSEDIAFQKSLKPFLKIHMHHTAVMYPDNEIFLQVKEADLKVKLLPLLLKQVVIKDAEFTRPIINIILYKDYSTSLEKYAVKQNIIDSKGYKLNSIANASLFKNYKIKFKDTTINKTFYLEGEELLLKDIQLNDKAHIYMKGAIFENQTEYIKYDIDLISSLTKREHLFTFSPFKTIMDTNAKGSITGHLKIDKDNNINGNLKADDLSLKLNDIISNSNNANIFFKGQEAEIDAVLHTSKSDIAKVKGKFSFGKKRSIDLNTNAKNINLENLFKIISSVTKILNLQNPLNDVQMKGLLDADFNLSSDFKKLKSQGSAVISNAMITHEKLPYPVKDINADIDFNNNNIKIEKAVAVVNNTPINLEGKVNENLIADLKVFSENLDLQAITAAFLNKKDIPFEIKKGKLNFNSEIQGNLAKNPQIDSSVHISDCAFIEKENKIPFNAEAVNININIKDNKYTGNAMLEKSSVEINKNHFSSNKFIFTFDDKNIKLPSNEIKMMNSPIIIDGEIKDYKENPIANINFNSDFASSDIGILLKPYINAPYKAEGKIKISGKASATKEKQIIKAAAKADKNNYLSYMVIKEILGKPSSLEIDCDIQNNKINLKNVVLSDDSVQVHDNSNKIVKINGLITTDKDIIFNNLKIFVPNYISAKTNFMGGEEFSFKADVVLNQTLNNPLIKGNASVEQYKVKKYLTFIKHADICFNDDNIRIIAPDVQINDSYFNVIADVIPSFNSNNLTISNMQINSLNLDLNNLFNMLYTNREMFVKTSLNIRQGTATINNLEMLDLKAKDITADFKSSKNILKMYNISANAYSGSISGQADYDLYSGRLNIDIAGKGVDIKPSVYDLCKLEDNLSGKTDFSSKVSMMTGDYNTVIKSISGNLNFNAINGGMGTLGKFEYYLSAKNLFYHGIFNATLNRVADVLRHDKTEQFKSAKGNVLFQNGYIISDGIQTVGNKMSLYIRGRHNMLTNQSNLDIYGKISDDIANKVGTFWNVSLSELFSGQASGKDIDFSVVPKSIMDNIPDLSNPNTPTNTFKVNILGDIKAMNSINSFEWIAPDRMPENTLIKPQVQHSEIQEIPKQQEVIEQKQEVNPSQNIEENTEEQNLPQFSDMLQNI